MPPALRNALTAIGHCRIDMGNARASVHSRRWPCPARLGAFHVSGAGNLVPAKLERAGESAGAIRRLRASFVSNAQFGGDEPCICAAVSTVRKRCKCHRCKDQNRGSPCQTPFGIPFYKMPSAFFWAGQWICAWSRARLYMSLKVISRYLTARQRAPRHRHSS